MKATMLTTVLLCTAWVLNGCAGIPGGELDTVTYDQIVAKEPRPSVSYEVLVDEVRFDDGKGSSTKGTLKYRGPKIQEAVETALLKSQVFAARRHGKENSSTPHLVFEWSVDGTGPVVAGIGGFVCGASFGIIPMIARLEYTLEVRVEIAGRCVKKYQYYEDETLMMGFLALPFAVVHGGPWDAESELWENMVRTFLRDLLKDRLLWSDSLSSARLSPRPERSG